MKSEPLKIADEKFTVNRLIEQAPTGTLIREFFKNAEENARLAAADNRRIEIYPVEMGGVRKLAFFNTGVGMDAEQLRKATDLSSSINKTMALDGNYGIGAKVSGLCVSKEGIRYRSCKDGRVHQVTIGYDPDQETYVRFADTMPDGKEEIVYDVTKIAQEDGKDVGYDWTEVVLYGESEDHDMIDYPLGKGKDLDRSYIPTTIFRRFSEIAEGVSVKVDVAMTKGGGKDETGRNRGLRTLDDVIKIANLRNESVSDAGSDIKVRYLYDPKHENSAHNLSARANPAVGSTTFCALVYKGERYDFKTGKPWSAVAPNFGIPFGSKVLTVEIFIPDDMAMPTQYRDALTNPKDRSPLTADDFSLWVRELMPEWVKEIIKAESPEAEDNLDDLQADLQKLLDEFRVPTMTRTASKKPEADTSNDNDEGIDSTEHTNIPDNDFMSDFSTMLRETDVEHGGKRAQKKKIRLAPDGAQASISSQALERVPEIKFLDDKEEIAEKEIKGRAGRYYRDAQTIFINNHYSVIERMAQELERELTGEGEPEQVRELALRASRRYMAFRVAKAVCYAISKKLADDWSLDDLDKATSPESLSMAADDYKQNIAAAKKWVKEQLKISKIEKAA